MCNASMYCGTYCIAPMQWRVFAATPRRPNQPKAHKKDLVSCPSAGRWRKRHVKRPSGWWDIDQVLGSFPFFWQLNLPPKNHILGEWAIFSPLSPPFPLLILGVWAFSRTFWEFAFLNLFFWFVVLPKCCFVQTCSMFLMLEMWWGVLQHVGDVGWW